MGGHHPLCHPSQVVLVLEGVWEQNVGTLYCSWQQPHKILKKVYVTRNSKKLRAQTGEHPALQVAGLLLDLLLMLRKAHLPGKCCWLLPFL